LNEKITTHITFLLLFIFSQEKREYEKKFLFLNLLKN
jgi:hypothetical protein